MALEKQLYEEITAEYEAIRAHKKREWEQRRTEVFTKVPELQTIDSQLKEASLSLSLSILKDPDHAVETLDQLKQQITSLQNRRKALLEQNGYPEDYLTLTYQCPLCKDTGYIGNKQCTCFQQRLIDRSYHLSNLENLTATQNFSHFDYRYYSTQTDSVSGVSPAERIRSIYGVCREFIDHFSEEYPNLLFYGPPGIGKTFMSSCIAKEILDKGHTVIYESAYDMFSLYEDYKFQRLSPAEARPQLNRLYHTDLLIIDDLGTEVISRSNTAFLLNVVDTRLRHHQKIIISTNQSISELSQMYSQRLTSRIFESFTQLEFLGTDIRLQKMRES